MSVVVFHFMLYLWQIDNPPAPRQVAEGQVVRSMTIPGVTMDTPILYRIKVSGIVGEAWFAFYDDMELEAHHTDGEYPLTTLTGRVADQTALLSMLVLLHDLRCVLISVDCLNDET